MDFDVFRNLALTALVGRQNENGSWSGDPIATISAIDALSEACGGPDPVCRFSGLYAKFHPDIAPREWLFRFSWGLSQGTPMMHQQDPFIGYVAAIYRGITFGWQSLPRDHAIDKSTAWVLSKWSRLNVLTDTDFQLHVPQDEMEDFSTSEAWLLALIGQARLHENAYCAQYHDRDLTARPDVVMRADRLVNLMKDDHWDSQSLSAEEVTAITGGFLFHECCVRVCEIAKYRIDLNLLRDRVLQWLVNRQSCSGSWAESAHVTAHCLKLLDTALCGVPADHLSWSVWLEAVRRGVSHLLRPEVQAQWTAMMSYQQIDVLAALVRLSTRAALSQSVFKDLRLDGSAFKPDVFISYGGPDTQFARKLAKDLEAAGIRIWFAEWDLDYGDDVLQEIEAGLNATTKFVIVLSPESIQRPWVKKELSAAFQQALSGPGKLIVPVMYRRCQVPPFLSAHRWADFTDDHSYAERTQELARRLKGRRAPRV